MPPSVSSITESIEPRVFWLSLAWVRSRLAMVAMMPPETGSSTNVNSVSGTDM